VSAKSCSAEGEGLNYSRDWSSVGFMCFRSAPPVNAYANSANDNPVNRTVVYKVVTPLK